MATGKSDIVVGEDPYTKKTMIALPEGEYRISAKSSGNGVYMNVNQDGKVVVLEGEHIEDSKLVKEFMAPEARSVVHRLIRKGEFDAAFRNRMQIMFGNKDPKLVQFLIQHAEEIALIPEFQKRIIEGK